VDGISVAYLEIWKGQGYISVVHFQTCLNFSVNFFHIKKNFASKGGGAGARPINKPLVDLAYPKIGVAALEERPSLNCERWTRDVLLYVQWRSVACGLWRTWSWLDHRRISRSSLLSTSDDLLSWTSWDRRLQVHLPRHILLINAPLISFDLFFVVFSQAPTVWLKKISPWVFLAFFPNGWEFLVQILPAY